MSHTSWHCLKKNLKKLCLECLHFQESLDIGGLFNTVENMERIKCLKQKIYIQLDKEYFAKEILLLHKIDLSLPIHCWKTLVEKKAVHVF